jgi:hypothetical protein
MKAELIYFKESGKYYSHAEMEIQGDKSLYEIWEIVRNLLRERRLPGLCNDHSNYLVLVNVPGHPQEHPHLIVESCHI